MKGIYFNLYRIKLGQHLYNNTSHTIDDINSINDFNFSNILDGLNTTIHTPTDNLLLSTPDVTIKFYTISETIKTLSWSSLYETITGEACSFKNKNNSYILFVFYKSKNGSHLFAVTGGNGYFKIKNYIDKSFAFNLINKLVEDTGVFGNVKQNHLVGQETYVERGFSSEYDVLSETSYWTINKEANIRIPKEKLAELGLEIENETKEKAGIFVAKGFKLMKSLNFHKLINLVIAVSEILNTGLDKIKMNRVMPIEDINLENKLYLELFKKLKSKTDDVLFLPDNEKMLFIADQKYVTIHSVNYDDFDNTNDILDFLEKYDKDSYNNFFLNVDFIDEGDISRAYKYFGGYDIHLGVEDSVQRFKFMESIYTNIEYHRTNYIFIHGKFYSLDINVVQNINDDFNDLLGDYGENIEFRKILPENWPVEKKEEDYLDLYKTRTDNYLILDKIVPEGVEFCDLMHVDHSTGKIYLIHVKTQFGNVSRDHSMQALMSCEKIMHNINSPSKNYFKKIYKNIDGKLNNFFLSEDDFIDKMSNKDNIFVVILAGYKSHGGKLSASNSYIGKVAMLHAMKKMTYNLGFKIKNIGLYSL